MAEGGMTWESWRSSVAGAQGDGREQYKKGNVGPPYEGPRKSS